jgi:nucleolar protein 53
MGKRSKAGTSVRQKKRAAETYKELEEVQIEQSDQQRVQSKADEELFVLDTNRNETAATLRAAARAKNNKKDDAASKKRKYEPSEKDMRQIKKVLEVHGEKGAIDLAEKGKARLEQKRIVKRMAGMAKAGKPTFDLWDEAPVQSLTAAGKGKRTKMVAVPVGKPALGGTNPVALVPKETPLPVSSIDSAFDAPIQPATKLSNKQLKARRYAQATAKPRLAVEVAHPGQSYHPDREQHQDAIGEALSIEIRRNEAEEYKSKPISEGMSAFTKEFIVGESDSEEESSDEEEQEDEVEGSGGAMSTKLIKKKDKLTRAQRNKQKRVKAEETALKERKLRKQFMHQLNEAHIHNKAVKQAEKERAERQSELDKLRSEKRAQPLGKDVWSNISQQDPIRAPSLPVALTEELHGSGGGNGGLRTVTPKGSLVTDRLESMVSRNMIQKKKAEGRRIVQGKRRPKIRGAQGTEYLLL